MSKSSKARSKEKRRRLKEAAKSAKRAQYAKWSEEGKNKKSKRFVVKKGKNKLVNSYPHEINYCGNPACKKCHTVDTKGNIVALYR